MPLLFAGYEMQIREPGESIDFLPMFLIFILFGCLMAFVGHDGLILILAISALCAIFTVPLTVAFFVGACRRWSKSEGSTSGSRSYTAVELKLGITRPQAASYALKFRAAEETFDNARFTNGPKSYGRRAQRAPLCWRFGRQGAPASNLKMLYESLHREPRREWDILLMFVSALPGDPDQPTVIAIGGADLDKVEVQEDGITIATADLNDKIPASSMRAIVCYRW